MAIKAQADEAHFIARPRERELARALDEAFDIEFGDRLENLSFWFANPKTHTRERFGLSREVLVIYSRHQRTDARVLTAIPKVTSDPRYHDRAEPVLTFVIHEGQDSDVERLDRPSDRVIVTFHAEELRNPQRGSLFIRSRIAKSIGSVDLFGVSSPIQSDAYFFGRHTLVEQLATKTFVKNENSGVFGLRKTGKTSVLRALERRATPYDRLVLYLDCESPSLYRVRWWVFLERLASAALEQVGLPPPDRTYTEDDAAARVAVDLRRALARAGASGVTVLLDEIEHITPRISSLPARHWDADFLFLWQALRAVQQENAALLSFVVAGVNPACVNETHFNEYPNPLFQFASPVYLEPLGVDAVRTMVRSLGRYLGLKFSEEAYSYLAKRFGGHAFLIRLACSEVWAADPPRNATQLREVRDSDFILLRGEIRARLSQPVKDILLSLVWWYPDEYDLLRVLAEGDAEFVRSYLRDVPASMLQFARYGLIDQGSGQFLIEELRSFLVDAGDRYKREVSPFRRSDLPPEVLPEVPDLVKLGQLFELKTQLEIRLRRVIVVYLGLRAAWDDQRTAKLMLKGLRRAPGRPDPADVFVGRPPREAVNQLFLRDLGDIVVANWDDFATLFDGQRTRFDDAIAKVNVARRHDSHTKPIADVDFRAFEAAYKWLLDHLRRMPDEFSVGLP